MYNYVLAVALITSPEDVSHSFFEPGDVSYLGKNWPVAENIQNLALDWELLDPLEKRYVLTNPVDFERDVKSIQVRYEKLHDAPFIVDANRFGTRDLAFEAKTFNVAYISQIQHNLAISYDKEYWRQSLEETRHLYKVWDLVYDSHCKHYYVTVRREALKNLRDAIGEDAYYSGKLPPPVPLWRFTNISTR
jgi:hypothetical protein